MSPAKRCVSICFVSGPLGGLLDGQGGPKLADLGRPLSGGAGARSYDLEWLRVSGELRGDKNIAAIFWVVQAIRIAVGPGRQAARETWVYSAPVEGRPT